MNRLGLVFCMSLLAFQSQEAWSDENCRTDIKAQFTGKVTENALGAVMDLGIFEVVNQSKSTISVLGWRWNGRFFVDEPDVWLEAGPDAAGWERLSYYGPEDHSAPHDKLTLAPGSKGVVDAPVSSARGFGVRPIDKIRLHLKLSDGSCIVSEPFANPYHK